jgi:hypothetical protein
MGVTPAWCMQSRVSTYPAYRTESLGIDCAVACLSVKKMLGQLPLDLEGLPSLIEGCHGLGSLGWHATLVEINIDAVC